MVIGVDAGAICETDDRLKVGVYRVTLELLKHLSRIDSVNTYRLYSFAPIPSDIMKNFGTNMVNICLSPSFGYMKFRLPLKLTVEPVDIFLGVAQAIPNGAKNAIGFIYDLGFLHHPEVYGAQAHVLAKQTETLVAKSAHIVTISKTTKDDIIKTYNVSPSNITVLYPGISDVFRKNKEIIHHPVPYFLMVGLIKPSKNIPLAICAFSQFLKSTKKHYDLIIIGGNTGVDTQSTDRVHILGRLPDREVAKWYKGATALLSLSKTEGFCLPAAESLASGCPVIYVNGGALQEIVGNAGIGVNNQEGIVHGMLRLSGGTIRNEYVKRCIDRSKLYSWNKFSRVILNSCLAGRQVFQDPL